MYFTALEECHQQAHLVIRRSSMSSEYSSKVRFSRSSIVPVGTRMFCLGLLALILTLPCDFGVGAVTFAFSGFKENDVYYASPPPPPSSGPVAVFSEVLPSPSLAPTSTPPSSRSPPPTAMTNPPPFNAPSPNISEPGPPPRIAKKGINLGVLVGVPVSVLIAGLFILLSSLCWWKVFSRPLRIFISHSGDGDGSGNSFPMRLCQKMRSRRWSRLKFRVKIFRDVESWSIGGVSFAQTVFEELTRFDIGIVVVTKEYFESRWAMIELIALVKAQKNELGARVRIVPLFYELTPDEIKVQLDEGTWENNWREMTKGTHPLKVEECREAVNRLCMVSGIPFVSQRRDADRLYIETICGKVDKILCEEWSFASDLRWALTGTANWGTKRHFTDTGKRRKRANRRARKEIALMTYVNRLLLLLFALSGLLIIFLSVILDNSFNDQLVRFTAFAILAPVMIFLGFLASGWFPRIPLWFIACVKRRGFLKHVMPCSPWHDNVVTDFCGEVCTLEPLKQAQGTALFELPPSVQAFLYDGRTSPQRTIGTASTQSTMDPEIQNFQETASTLEPQGQDLHEASTLDLQSQFDLTSSIQDSEDARIVKRPHIVMTTGQVSSPYLQDEPHDIEDIIVQISDSSMFYISDKESVPMLAFEGPKIYGIPLKVQAFKNMSTRDHTFDLSCTFRNKKTSRMYLTTGRLQNLAQNMCQWVENPHPIVVNKSSDILHCMAIQDILWEFTKGVYTFKSVFVRHRFLAGTGQFKFIIILSYLLISYLLSLIPLISDKKSYFFLFFLLVLVPYLFTLENTNPLNFYYFRSFFCPILMKVWGFRRLYRSRSLFIWCNEFRKERVVDPTYFWIDQECANRLSDADGCFDGRGFVKLPDSPPKGQSFTMICQGWPADDPTKRQTQHDYKLRVNFDTFKPSDTCYTNVRLSFYENDDLLGDRNYGSVETQRLHLVETLFHCYSNPSFGGYVETIIPGFRSNTYFGHCRRFLDICDKLITDETIPTPLVAARKSGSKLTIGVPFWSSTTPN